MRITKVTTKKGDSGMTSLAGGERVLKNDPRICAEGSIDELNAAVGFARSLLEHASLPELPEEDQNRFVRELEKIQHRLFVLGVEVCVRPEQRREDTPRLTPSDLADLEERIDALCETLPPLVEFVLPTGSPPVAALHLARTLCRRAERDAVTLAEREDVGEYVIPYLNRLSDYLFVLSRGIAAASGEEERTWKRE